MTYSLNVCYVINAVAKYCDEHVCMCVRLSVCPRGYPRNHTCDLYQIFVHVAYGRGSVLLQQGDEISRGRGSFGGFHPHWQCIVQHSIWDPYKNGYTNRDAVCEDEWAWHEEQCVTWGDDPRRVRAILGENMCPTSLILRSVANWTILCSGVYTIGTDAWLQALDESIIGGGGLGLHTENEVWYLRLPCLLVVAMTLENLPDSVSSVLKHAETFAA